jgi:hypothetical protein
MKYNDFLNKLDDMMLGEYIVEVHYKYSYEDAFTVSNEILTIEADGITWLNDWWEGQEDVFIGGFIRVDALNIPEIILQNKSVVNSLYGMCVQKNT